MKKRRVEPRRRNNSIDDELGSKVLVEEIGLVLGLVNDPLLPLEDLHEQLLHRRHVSQKGHEKRERIRSFEVTERKKSWVSMGGFLTKKMKVAFCE